MDLVALNVFRAKHNYTAANKILNIFGCVVSFQSIFGIVHCWKLSTVHKMLRVPHPIGINGASGLLSAFLDRAQGVLLR